MLWRLLLRWVVALSGCWILGIGNILAQTYLEGRVVSQAEPQGVAGALVYLRGTSYGAYTDSVGNFRIAYKGALSDSLIVESIGYQRSGVALAFYPNCDLHIALQSSTHDIESVRITANYNASKQRATTQTLRIVGAELITQRRQSTLAQTLEQVPGVQAMTIGNGASKPMIRGMGFNRIAVLDRGIKQEGQQWGADHGLELDQMAADHVGVYKGATSLRWGGDAMGGAIAVNADIPIPLDGFHTKGALWYASNSQLGGISLRNSYAGQKFFYALTLTGTDYADYSVPVDTIVYMTRKIPIYNRKLKNTAGTEKDATLTLGLDSYYGVFALTASHVYQKIGFFPGSHGLPSQERVQPDCSARNVDFPYSRASHSKLILNYRSNPRGRSWTAYLDLGVQYNVRDELSAFHTHYPEQSRPEKDADLELALRLWTYSISRRVVWKLPQRMQFEAGAESQWQDHSFKGYNFLLPRYYRYTLGLYATYSWQPLPELRLEAGLRGDYARLNVKPYYDTILEQYLVNFDNITPLQREEYATLSPRLNRNFINYSWALGASWTPAEHHALKMHMGRSFRLPSVHELAANGVHHGSFRHEKGDSKLGSELGHQLDLEYVFNYKKFHIGLNPFLAYYSSYIYLNPSGNWSRLPDGGQIYQFSQARVLSYGGELEVHGHLLRSLSISANAAWVLLDNLTDGYPLPFTPPLSLRATLSWKVPWIPLRYGSFTLEGENFYAMAQERVSRNELTTPSAWHADAKVVYTKQFSETEWTLRGAIKNLTDRRYFNHLSYYRVLGIPEPGRSFNLELTVSY